MVPRILLDLVKRRWFQIAFAVFQVSWIIRAIWQFAPGSDVWAAPLASLWFLTTMPAQMLVGRENYQLPVSRSEWWRARWWMSTAGAATVATLAAAAARLQMGRPQEGVQRVVLFMSFAFLYAGCVMALVATRVGRQLDQPVDRQPKLSPPGTFKNDPTINLRRFTAGIFLRAIGSMLGVTVAAVALSFQLARWLPHTSSEISVTSAVMALVMLAATVFSYRHRPAIVARPGPRGVRAARGSESAKPGARGRFVDRLTGLRLALWEEGQWQLISFVTVMVLLFVGWAAKTAFSGAPALPMFLASVDALPFSASAPHETEPFTWITLFFLVLTLDALRMTGVRPLRVLPMSTARLSGLPVAIGLISASALWVTLLALHFLTQPGPPVTLRPDLFIGFAAIMSITHTIRLSTPAQTIMRSVFCFAPIILVVAGSLFFLDSWRPGVWRAVLFFGGLAGLGTSYAAMRLVVQRGSWIYRRPTIAVRFQ